MAGRGVGVQGVPGARAVIEMRQEAFDHRRVFDQAITFIFPPQVSQISRSLLNTRFKRCAHLIAAW